MIYLNTQIKDKSKTKTSIYIEVRYSGEKRTRIYIKENINPKNWNNKKRIANKSEGSQRINYRIKLYQDTIKRLYDVMVKENKILSSPDFKKLVEVTIDGTTEETDTVKEITVLEWIEKFLQLRKSKKENVASTIRAYNNVKVRFTDFQNYKGKTYYFKDMNIDFIDDYIEYMYINNYTPNYTHKNIRIIKMVLKDAAARGLNKYSYFKEDYFKGRKTKPRDYIALTDEDLKQIAEFNAGADWNMHVRDAYLIMCYTGFRYCDYYKVRKENIIPFENGKRALKIKMQKTNDFVVVPIMEKLDVLMQKYNWRTPKIYTNQKINEYIKEICRKIGMDEEVTITTWGGGVKKIIKRKKYQEIYGHTARRSFATILYRKGIDIYSVSKMLGHKDVKTTISYLKITSEDLAAELSLHPAFNE